MQKALVASFRFALVSKKNALRGVIGLGCLLIHRLKGLVFMQAIHKPGLPILPTFPTSEFTRSFEAIIIASRT